MNERVSVARVRVIIGCLGLACLAWAPRAFAQGDPVAPPPVQGDYYVPPGYSAEPPPPQTYPAPEGQPYPAPQAQPYPAPQAQPYPQQPYAQQPYAQQPYAQQQPGRRRLERLGAADVVPEGVEVIERRRLVLSFVGAGLFVGAYAAPLAIMIDSGFESRRTAIPIVGALLENGHSNWLFGGYWGLAVLDAGMQALGLTLFALGMRRQRYAVYYVDTARGRTLALSPGAGPRGVSLHMAF